MKNKCEAKVAKHFNTKTRQWDKDVPCPYTGEIQHRDKMYCARHYKALKTKLDKEDKLATLLYKKLIQFPLNSPTSGKAEELVLLLQPIVLPYKQWPKELQDAAI